MSNIAGAKYNIRLLEELAGKKSPIHAFHPLAKVLVTLFFIIDAVSFEKYDALNMAPLFLYPVVLFSWAEIPVQPILKRLACVSPLILGIGILNPVFDRQMTDFSGILISRGWLAFLSITVKSVLVVAASLLLMATTGMNDIAGTLRMFGIPGVFVLQLQLTYRYIAVLIEEVFRVVTAYSLRVPRYKGVKPKAWGPVAGRLLIRTMDRSHRIYQAMLLRGFKGEYHSGYGKTFTRGDGLYILAWSAFFLIVRIFPIPSILGNLFSGGA